jgi:hypothetical protein
VSGDIVERLGRISGGSAVVEVTQEAADEIELLRADVERLRAQAGETEDHVHYLLDSYHLWSEDGVFAMPDGWVYSQGGGPS